MEFLLGCDLISRYLAQQEENESSMSHFMPRTISSAIARRFIAAKSTAIFMRLEREKPVLDAMLAWANTRSAVLFSLIRIAT